MLRVGHEVLVGPRHWLYVAPWQLVFAVTLVFVSTCLPVHAQTIASDKAALLSFKAAVGDAGGILSSWSEYTDPCADDWAGVKCNCFPFFEDTTLSERSQVCTPPAPEYTSQRVLQLHLGDVRITNWNILSGVLPTALSSLTALRVLNLKGHNFTGPIPYSFNQLKTLEVLVLSYNSLNGTIPSYLNTFLNMKYVYLDHNQFSGALPTQWCSSWWLFDIRNNNGLCDEIPYCLTDRLISLEGTSLIDPVGDTDKGMGGYCDVSPPTCRREQDACWVQGPEPPYWTNASAITFSFPDFPSIEGGEPASYHWSVGTQPGAADVLPWRPFAGNKTVTQSAEVEDDLTGEKSIVTQVVNVVNEPLPSWMSLREGGNYYVSVRGSNAGGPLLGIVVHSDVILVETTPPSLPDGAAVYSGEYFNNQPAQTATNGLGVSWDSFVDDESDLEYYSYQVFMFKFNYDSRKTNKASSNYAGDAITEKVRIDNKKERSLYISKLDLEPGQSYFVRIYATNKVGNEGFRDAPPVAIVTNTSGIVTFEGEDTGGGVAVSKVVILVAVLVGATSASVAVATFWLARERYRRRQVASRKYQGQMRNLRHQLHSLVDNVGNADGKKLEELRQLKDVAFVITDLENSTGIASLAPRAYERVQEAHDTLLRDLIATFGGYEINTEGDAFHITFKSVAAAVRFCMECQYQMMEVDWPREVLKLAGCREFRAPNGGWMFRGPRVRMAVHWAAEGSVMQHVHQLTKHRVFTGPAFQMARELCEAANGGQVLLTHSAWERVRADMAAAAFPVVEQLGCFKLSSKKDTMWVYHVRQLLGKPLHREFGGLLGEGKTLQPSQEGWGLSIVPVPKPKSPQGNLSFVACRLALETCSETGTATVPAILSSCLHTVLAMAAQQFSGHMFRLSESQGCYLLAFGSCVDAVRFCHAAQVLLAYTTWPPECAEWFGKTEGGSDGSPLFKGPRVAMAIHESNDYSTRPVPRARPSPDDPNAATDYLGPAEEGVKAISEVAHGGQVVLSETAWAAVQDHLPGQPQIVSLGTHWVDEPCFPRPLMLMEVMPLVLAKRSFPPPRLTRLVEPGYRDAPDASSDVALVQLRINRPKEVGLAESTLRSIPDDEGALRTIEAYSMGVSVAVKAVRNSLRGHNGYECKETEPGKFTLAFRYLEDAVRWACALQEALLELPWPEPIVEWEDCAPEIEDCDADSACEGLEGTENRAQALLWKGLKTQVGISFGVPTSKAPLKTGRADYFGALPNLAARLMRMAQPGQVLVDGARVGGMRGVKWSDDVGLLVGPQGSQNAGNSAVEVSMLGSVPVRGMEDTRVVYQALPISLRGRRFEELPSMPQSGAARRVPSLRMTRPDAAVISESGSPHHHRKMPRIFASISRTGSQTSRAVWASSFSSLMKNSDSDAGSTQQAGAAGVYSRPGPRSNSASSSVGGGSWIAHQQQRSAALAMGPRASTLKAAMGVGESEMSGTPASTSDALRQSLVMRDALGEAGQPLVPGSIVGSYQSDILVTAQDTAFGADLGSAVAVGSPPEPRTYVSLRDISDWSFPGSTLNSPTSRMDAVDHWDAGLTIEAALKQDGLPPGPDLEGGFYHNDETSAAPESTPQKHGNRGSSAMAHLRQMIKNVGTRPGNNDVETKGLRAKYSK